MAEQTAPPPPPPLGLHFKCNQGMAAAIRFGGSEPSIPKLLSCPLRFLSIWTNETV